MVSVCTAVMDLSDDEIVYGGEVAAVGVFEPESGFFVVDLERAGAGGEED